MFTRRNVLRAVGIFLVIGAGLLGLDQIGDGEYLQAVVWFAVAALWAVWTILSPAFSWNEPGKKPHPLQSVIPFATTLLLILAQFVR
jgi:hypothetical protein